MYKVGLLNDSFPPTIDGVANAVFNYADIITKKYGKATVITPKYPNVVDDYPFEVYRYQSAKFSREMPYRVGNPFSPGFLREIGKLKLDILHTHCPFSSGVLARELALLNKIPTVLTYHTKFDIDIDRYVENKQFNTIARKFILNNINSADEVWAVSEGTIKSLRDIGYEGNVIVMPNGTDFTRGKASAEMLDEIDRMYKTKNEKLVFLYCGRMMWYKNIQITLDALKIIKEAGISFKMFFVGDGVDRPSIEAYAKRIGVYDRLIFTGAIYDREKIRAYFTRADLFLFPSTYDTSGLVVKEAAACSCASALIKGSCAAENIENGVSGILAERETAESFAKSIIQVVRTPDMLKRLGDAACEKAYYSWDDSIAAASKRYEIVIENYKSKCR